MKTVNRRFHDSIEMQCRNRKGAAAVITPQTQGAFVMAEERITEVETPTGNTHTHTTVITHEPRSGGGGATWLIVLLLIVAVIVALFFFSGMSNSEVAKDNAVAEAANSVGNAAQDAGAAVEDAAKNVGN
jgi:hypothetical protein